MLRWDFCLLCLSYSQSSRVGSEELRDNLRKLRTLLSHNTAIILNNDRKGIKITAEAKDEELKALPLPSPPLPSGDFDQVFMNAALTQNNVSVLMSI